MNEAFENAKNPGLNDDELAAVSGGANGRSGPKYAVGQWVKVPADPHIVKAEIISRRYDYGRKEYLYVVRAYLIWNEWNRLELYESKLASAPSE